VICSLKSSTKALKSQNGSGHSCAKLLVYGQQGNFFLQKFVFQNEYANSILLASKKSYNAVAVKRIQCVQSASRISADRLGYGFKALLEYGYNSDNFYQNVLQKRLFKD